MRSDRGGMCGEEVLLSFGAANGATEKKRRGPVRSLKQPLLAQTTQKPTNSGH